MDSPTLDSKPEVKNDPLLSPVFLPPGEDTSSSSSPNPSSLHSGSPRNDWAFSGPAWNSLCDSKSQALDDANLNLNLGLSFTSSLSQDQWPPMNIDTDITTFIPDSTQHFSIDPSTLQLGPAFHESPHESLSGNCDSMFQFMLSQPPDLALEPPVPIQLPSPQTVSISSRSVSPASSKLGNNGSAGVNPNDLSLLTQISQRAREAVGVTSAVPIERKSKGVAEGQTPISPVSPVSAASQPKVPIPRLRPSAPATQNPNNTTVHMLPNSQQLSASASEFPETAMTIPLTKTGRPKTSHTTIERRYRTNLNARILALRRAVPALRILEKNTPIQTQGKGLTGASAARWDFDDVVNERGYVDGVKAAKKNSKGVVLGKAVEYIRALKRRETRLKREAQGLRELISGLVGGADLLREWERAWRDRFGGEEVDEVDEDADENEEGDADGEDAEEAEDGESEDDGRAKKRARLEKKERKSKPSPVPQAEKRKRGRPRKNPPPDPPGELPHLVLQPQDVQNHHQPSKYLMATFLLFSFFNGNSPSTRSNQGHEGSVLTHVPDSGVASADLSGWTILQATNMLVSVLLLLSLVGPYLPATIARLLPHVLIFGSPGTHNSSSVVQKRNGHLASTSPSQEIAVSIAYASGNEEALRNALGADGSIYSALKGGGWALLENVKRALHIRRRTGGMITRQGEIVLRGWRRISQLEVLYGANTSFFSKIQAYFSFSSCLPSSAVSPSDHITLSLLAHSFSASTAAELWEMARHSDSKTYSEALVLELDVGEAVGILSACRTQWFDLSEEAQLSSVHRIAAHVVFNRTKTLAARQFISSVSGQRVVDLDNAAGAEGVSVISHDTEVKSVAAVGKELGGALGDLTSLLNKVERCPAAEVLPTLPPFEFEVDNESGESSSENGSGSEGTSSVDAQFEDAVKDTRLLLLATLLYRRIFPVQDTTKTHVLSPPPSPKPQRGGLHLTLRRALASKAFDASPDTEDARDRVVDMLAETRRGRSAGGVRNIP